MKQVAQNYKTGELSLVDVPVPTCRPGGLLVRTTHSLISTGTEKAKVGESKLSLIGKARARPDQVRKVLDSVAQQGVASTAKKAVNRLDRYTPLGYSLAGVVEQVGDGVVGFSEGQLVACAGNEYADHAEFNWVPRNLCVPVPDSVSAIPAAFTTVGAIAVQGYRQSSAQLGETAVVIGLGLVGQLLVQILGAAGINVIGIDVSQERCSMAESLGAVSCAPAEGEGLVRLRGALANLTDGAGADHVFLAASTSSPQPVRLAAELARDRARIIDIGKCNLDLPWGEYYEKELEVRFSRSYGPGRYDPVYEEQGVDYPIGYVRWTEERNMKSFLGLIAGGAIDIDPLISEIVPFDQAVETYERLHADEIDGIGIVFQYQEDAPLGRVLTAADPVPVRSGTDSAPRPSSDIVRLGVIGAGNYATTMLLPHLQDKAGVKLATVATATALSAANAQRKFGFATVTTDYQTVLADDTIDAVLIATRHDSHSRLAAEALLADKAVFVEKPLAINPDGLQMVVEAIAESGNDRLMVGFNRRFSPILRHLQDSWGPRQGPVIVQYSVNAGRLEGGSWYSNTELHGSRFVGEGGHFIDTVSWWLGADPTSAYAVGTPDEPDNLTATLRYLDGSVVTITYASSGARGYPKEIISMTGEGKVGRLSDFRRVDLWRGGRRKTKRMSGVDKGQEDELVAFLDAIRRSGPMPIPITSLFATTSATLAVELSLRTGAVEPIRQVQIPGLE